MTKACDLNATEALQLIHKRELSPTELLDSCLQRIDEVNGSLNAMVAMDIDRAKSQALEIEKQILAGEETGFLAGLPIAVKDLSATQGLRTTYGSLLYENHIPNADDDMVANVRARGGNILGKSNTPEFGAGANTTNRVYGATGNPFDPDKTCAGSSGGAAVALATGMVPLATGSDYGGSLRTPAAFCGVTGFRPSPGLVPTGNRPVSLSPFAVTGPMGRTVADAHLLLRAQLDVNKHDPFSSSDAHKIPSALSGRDLSTLRVAWSADLGCAPVDNEIRRTFNERVGLFSHHFAECFERDPDLTGVHECFEVIRGMNFVAAHGERLKQHRELLGPNVIDNTQRGFDYQLEDVANANNIQSKIYHDFLNFFDDNDILICPAAAVSPFPHAQLSVEKIDGEVMPTYMRWLALSYGLTMALPSVCVLPCGVDHLGMPFGIQVAGPNGSDTMILEVAHSLEAVLAQHTHTARPLPDV